MPFILFQHPFDVLTKLTDVLFETYTHLFLLQEQQQKNAKNKLIMNKEGDIRMALPEGGIAQTETPSPKAIIIAQLKKSHPDEDFEDDEKIYSRISEDFDTYEKDIAERKKMTRPSPIYLLRILALPPFLWTGARGKIP